MVTGYWINSAVELCRPDTVVFDVDGVLLDDTVSFRAAVIATVEYLTKDLGAPRVTLDEIAAFKRAGGLNNDWDMAYTLVALLNSKYGGIDGNHGGIESANPTIGDATLEELAVASAGGGMGWVEQVVAPGGLPNYEVVKQIVDEFYWGSELLRERVGETPRYIRSHPGFVRQEPTLVPPDFLGTLITCGVEKFGIVTGRNRVEMVMGLELLGFPPEQIATIVTAEELSKPDPRALQRVVEQLRPRALLYVGDTGDDLELVKRYRAEFGQQRPQALAVIIAPREDWPHWQERGVDVLLASTMDLPAVLLSAGTVCQ